MCVIAVCEKRRLTHREIEQMNAANPHGIGLAWVNKGHGLVEYVKGLTAAEAIALVDRLPMPQVVHFRLASVGGVRPELCHPFPIEATPALTQAGSAPSVLFHNGHWGEWEGGLGLLSGIDESEPWSDTRVMAALMDAWDHGAVSEVVGTRQKLVVVTPTKIKTYGEFLSRRGIKVSNVWWTFEKVSSKAWSSDDVCRMTNKATSKSLTTAIAARETEDATANREQAMRRAGSKPPAKAHGPRCSDPTHCKPLHPAAVPRPLGPSRYFPRKKR
jgi:hypothetical protein